MVKYIRKRDGRIEKFDPERIRKAVQKALKATGVMDNGISDRVTSQVVGVVDIVYRGERIPSVEEIQDLVERFLMEDGYIEVAKAYILYREQRAKARDIKRLMDDAVDIVESYVGRKDWKVNENSNMEYSLQGLNFYISSTVVSKYWLTKLYPKEVRKAHEDGDFHIHDLGILGAYCVGWDLEDLLRRGFGGVPGKVESRPPKHLRSALGQIVNFFYTLQGEAAGAQAFSNFDTLLAPFVRVDNLNQKQVDQAMQEFIFNLNVPTRVGFQTPFTNITLDLEPSPLYRDRYAIVGGKEVDFKYGELQHEMNMINRAFFKVMMEGDAKGRIFTFPIPTYNITEDFNWDNPELEGLWLMAGKYGIPYFANFVNSDMKPEDARSMCCRLRLDNRELRKRGGGLFGANPLTGSIGVVTINMPRIGYLSRTEEEFFERLKRLMDIAMESLEIKRKVIENFTEKGLYPYAKNYLSYIKETSGHYWTNHFSTIGLVGMNEMVLNFKGIPIYEREAREFSIKVLNFMRNVISEYQEETGHLYNLEATPAESASYRLARIDKTMYPDIITAGESTPYYTNSVHLPVDYTDDIFYLLKHQDDLQVLFTGGTVVHIFVGESIHDWRSVRNLVRNVVTNFRLPYFTITPTFSISPTTGFLQGEHRFDPRPQRREDFDKYGVEIEVDEEELSSLPEGSYIIVEEGSKDDNNILNFGLKLKK